MTVVGDQQWWGRAERCVAWCDPIVWIRLWTWATPLGHCWFFTFIQVFFSFTYFFLLLISPYQLVVGLDGLDPCLCT